MLYLIATPIGNLQDITYRAVETLKQCDYILCEDTRHTLGLLKHYEIHKPLKSFHKFCEAEKEKAIIQDLLEGKIIGLVSDAGTPGIADPGTRLVQECILHNIKVTSIPGACALITALSCSGLDTDQFMFYGFLPKKQSELSQSLQTILTYPFTTVCYETPHRIKDTLTTLHELDPFRQLVIARELTKKFEELLRGTASDLLTHQETHLLKGEIVLLISKSTSTKIDWESLSPEEHVEYMQSNFTLSRQEAIKMVAKLRGLPKRDVYNKFNRCDQD